jgi:hypothetical protein
MGNKDPDGQPGVLYFSVESGCERFFIYRVSTFLLQDFRWESLYKLIEPFPTIS